MRAPDLASSQSSPSAEDGGTISSGDVTSSGAAGGPASERIGALASLLSWQSLGAAVSALLAFVIFVIVAPHFLSLGAWASILLLSAELGVVAVGVTLLMITGEYDLSIGSVAALAALVLAVLSAKGVSVVLALIIVLVMGIAIGLINGVFVTFAKAPSLIVTLGGMFFWQSVVLASTEGYSKPLHGYGLVGTLFASTWHEFSVSILWWLAVVVIFGFVLRRTRLGNHIFATGGDAGAARNLGVHTRRVKIAMFVLTAVLASLMGLMEVGRYSSANPTIGQNMELTAIAAVVIGGTQLSGGSGSIVGATFGVLTLGMIQVGLQLAAVPPYFFEGIVGLILLAAVLINLYTGKLTMRARS
ncbi:MAG TPA: ABC transporter permease [Solirubrobacteraceae bacterium]|jgi:simple sugar transport system permease protein